MTYDPYPGGQSGGYPPNPGGQPGGYQPYPGGGPGGYQPYPGGGSMPPQQRPSAPSSVVNAVRLMYAGAVFTALAVILGLTRIGSVRNSFQHHTNPVFTASQVNTAVNVFIGTVIAVGLIVITLWLWMSLMCTAVKNWARITSTVFFGIGTIVLVRVAVAGGAAGTLIVIVLGWLTGLGAVVLLWRKESSAFFKGPQYPGTW